MYYLQSHIKVYLGKNGSENIVKITKKYSLGIHFVITLQVAVLQLYQKQTLEDVSEKSQSQHL